MVMVKQIGHVLKQQIARVPGFSQAGKLKEKGAAGVSEAPASASTAVRLARETAAEQVEAGHGVGIGFSGIFCVPLSLRVKQGAVAALGVFVALAVSRAGETAGTGQPLAEAADASEHIDKLDGVAFPLKRKRPAVSASDIRKQRF